jgi:hypothetical protein
VVLPLPLGPTRLVTPGGMVRHAERKDREIPAGKRSRWRKLKERLP